MALFYANSNAVPRYVAPQVQVQVKFYCDIRLTFVKKDHQLVYRYNTEAEEKIPAASSSLTFSSFTVILLLQKCQVPEQ